MVADTPASPNGLAGMRVCAVVIALLECMGIRDLSTRRRETGDWSCGRPARTQHSRQVVAAALWRATGRCGPRDICPAGFCCGPGAAGGWGTSPTHYSEPAPDG